MTATPTFQSVPDDPGSDAPSGLRAAWRNLAMVVRSIRQGKLDCTGSITLTANAATSTLTDPRLAQQSKLLLFPNTANASAEIGAGTIYITAANKNKGSWVITHANNAQADRTFDYVIVG